MIRRYRPADSTELLSVWHAAARLAHPFWTPAHFEEERRAIVEDFLPIAETWVFENDGRVAGFVSVMENEVGGLFVSPAAHRRGIGRALMDHVRTTRDTIELEVFEANELGRAFYEAYGFAAVANRRDEDTGMRILRLKLEC